MTETPPPPAQILQIAASKFLAKPLYVAAHLGVADLLAEGPMPITELARRTQTHEASLYRVLRCLASAGIFREGEDRMFALTPAAEMIRTGEGTLRGMVLWLGDPRHDHVWESFLWSVTTGQPAVEKAHGLPVFDWLATQPDLAEIFNDAMTGNANVNHGAVVGVYDFSGVQRLVDVGGGHGALVARIAKATPGLRGVIYDLPSVIEGTRRHLAEWGLSDRIEAVTGDFFKEVPAGDAHIMSFILHDWDDERCVEMLRNCHRASVPGGKLLAVEIVVAPGNEPSLAKLIDMEMLALPGGRERSADEYRALLAAAGWEMRQVIPTPAPVSLIEAFRA